MTWTAPMTAVSGAVFTAAQFNTFVRDNLAEQSPAKAASASGYFAVSGTNELEERVAAQDFESARETTTSTTYADLATVGPAVTCTTGSAALVIVACQAGSTTVAAASARMGWEVSGATVLAADDAYCCGKTGGTSDLYISNSNFTRYDALTPGVNTFTAKYRVSSGTGTFVHRRITVIPF
jgi:hypothetical protein